MVSRLGTDEIFRSPRETRDPGRSGVCGHCDRVNNTGICLVSWVIYGSDVLYITLVTYLYLFEDCQRHLLGSPEEDSDSAHFAL